MTAIGPRRVVSLIASATEMVCALGCEARLVGRSHECDVPDSVRRLPACSEPRLDVKRPGRDIDASVRSILQEALLSLQPARLADVWEDVERVAGALGVGQRGRDLRARLERRVREVAARAAPLSPRPTVACIEWIEPLMAAGNWMPELVDLAGGMNLFGEAGRHSPWMSWEDLAAADPDVIVVLPCGFDLNRTASESRALPALPGWDRLRAAREGRVFLADGHLFFNRPGPRLVESLETLAEILHPAKFRFGHQGSGWQPFHEAG